MNEKPLISILDREEARRLSAEHFSDQVALIRDLTNFGSNLVLRAYNSSKKDIPDIVVCTVLLKHIVAMLDSIESLMSEGIVNPAFLPVRAAFEASIYLDWILFSDTDHKAKCYMVSNYRDERLWAKRAIKGTAEESLFTKLVEGIGVDTYQSDPTLQDKAEQHLEEVNRILAQPSFQSIDAEFDRKKGRRKIDPEWYEVAGAKSIRQVAESVGRLPEYEMFYSKGSEITHSASYQDHIRFVKDGIHFKPLRLLGDTRMLVTSAVSIATHSFQSILRYYRPDELKTFAKKYAEDWRAPFLGVKSVKYT